MPGKYYLKHTINHMVDNQARINKVNNSYKAQMINDAISYIKNSDDNLSQKVAYLQNLKHDQYRYGRKYKYECNLNEGQIGYIIRTAGNDELFLVYYGKTKEQADRETHIALVVILLVFAILFIMYLILAIVKLYF